jgi:hypothetical protein
MQTFLQRSIWLAVWAATMAITFWICADMAQDQPILLSIIVLCTIVMSVALVYMRIHWRDQNRTSAGAALFVGILCLGVTIVSEVSYWSSTISGMHENIQREKALSSGQDLVKERRRAQLSQAVGGKLPAQIKAEIAVAGNRAELVALKAQLNAAEELEKLQGQVIADSTSTVNFSIKRSFYEAASLGSENLGGDVRAWILGIVALIVGCMLSLHLLSLYIGFAPTAPVAARTAPKPLTLSEVAEKASPPATKPLKLSDDSLNRIVAEIPAPLPAIQQLFDPEDPKPGGGKKLELKPSADAPAAKESPVAEMQKTATAAFFETDGNVIEFLSPKQHRDIARGGRKKKEGKRSEGNVVDWLVACTSQTPDKRVKATSQDCRKSYMAWCSINRLQPVGHKQMSRIISVEIYRGNEGARGPRNGKGAVFPGLLVAMPIAEQIRKRA